MKDIKRGRGKLIVIEGTDGSGKETQAKLIVERLKAAGVACVFLAFPKYGTATGDIIGDCYLGKGHRVGKGSWFKDADGVDPKVASLYYAADRRNSVDEIKRLLSSGINVICDRYYQSNMAHQGGKIIDDVEREKMFDWLEKLEVDLLGLPREDFVIFLHMPTEVSFKLRDKRDGGEVNLDGHETNIEHLKRAEKSYLQLVEKYKWKTVKCAPDGTMDSLRSIEDIAEEVKKIVESEMGKRTKYKTLDEVPEEIKDKVKRYFSNVGGDNFVIMNLPPELTGGSLARYSRAPYSMQLTLINEFLDENGEPCQEKGSELMDRVLNAFGDDSIGELEGTHIGIENASMILIKTIEDRRIGGSPIEQSTRYVKYDNKDKDGKWRYYRPPEIIKSGFLGKYEEVNNKAFEVYRELVERLVEYFKNQLPEDEFEIDVERNNQKIKVRKHELISSDEERAFKNAYSFTIRCAALDVGRCILPSSTLSQLGIFGNGRFFTNLINTLKASELEEERLRGYDIEKELNKIIPTFIKRNKECDTCRRRNLKMREIADNLFSNIVPVAEEVTLVPRDDYFNEIISGVLYNYTNISLAQILEEVRKMSYSVKIKVLQEYAGVRKSRRDRTPRGAENGYPITFDLVGTFAEYRDLERHRMLTQQRQLLSTDLGFIMPSEVIQVGFEDKVLEVVKEMEILNKEIRDKISPVVAQYATLFNHRIRFYLGMNLREFQHLAELRTSPSGHFGYRAMTMEMARQLVKRDPWCKDVINFVDYSDPDNKISRSKEQAKIAGKNIAKGVDGGVDLE